MCFNGLRNQASEGKRYQKSQISIPALTSLLEEHHQSILAALSAELRSAFSSLEAKLHTVQAAVIDFGERIVSLKTTEGHSQALGKHHAPLYQRLVLSVGNNSVRINGVTNGITFFSVKGNLTNYYFHHYNLCRLLNAAGYKLKLLIEVVVTDSALSTGAAELFFFLQ